MLRRIGKILVVGAIGALVGLVPAGPAAAHNSLTSADPEDGATVEQGPEQVTLTFLSTLDPATTEVSVTGPDGEPAVREEPDFDGATVTVAVTATAPGDYTVAYEVASDDGHPITGTVEFAVTGGAESPTPSPSARTSPSPELSPEPAQEASPPATALPAAGEAGDGSRPWWPWVVVGVMLVLGTVSSYEVIRRRRTR